VVTRRGPNQRRAGTLDIIYQAMIVQKRGKEKKKRREKGKLNKKKGKSPGGVKKLIKTNKNEKGSGHSRPPQNV